jgi:hypothetical protein
MKIEEVQSTTKKQRVATHTHIKVREGTAASAPEEEIHNYFPPNMQKRLILAHILTLDRSPPTLLTPSPPTSSFE